MNIASSNPINTVWDFIIIGAGPAGAMAACRLAGKNRVLLIDQAAFPREKTCGGCLNANAVREFEYAGLGDLLKILGAKPIHSLHLVCAGASTKIQIPLGLSISRKRMDQALIKAAQKNGATFLDSTKGILNSSANENTAEVTLIQGEKKSKVNARMVLICDGLSGSSLQNFPQMRAAIASDSLVGVSTSFENSSHDIPAGTIQMICGKEGYVGIVTREDSQIELAAAVTPAALKSDHAAIVISKILNESGLQIQNLNHVKWLGAPHLLRERDIPGGERFFVLGDAAGFVEPFTGEGMYWALLQARKLTELLEKENFEWNLSLLKKWRTQSHQILNFRKKACRLITLILRAPLLCRLLISLLNFFPGIGTAIARSIHQNKFPVLPQLKIQNL